MAPSPKCAALASAMSSKELSYKQVADSIGKSEQHVIDICTGNATPTDDEYNALAGALGISDGGKSSAHAKK